MNGYPGYPSYLGHPYSQFGYGCDRQTYSAFWEGYTRGQVETLRSVVKRDQTTRKHTEQHAQELKARDEQRARLLSLVDYPDILQQVFDEQDRAAIPMLRPD